MRDDAGPITFQHAFVRALIGFVEIYLFTGVPAFFSALVNGRGKRLGDFAAGTYVVRARVTLRLAPPCRCRRTSRAGRAGDITSLPTGLALAVRQYLGRLPTLDPSSRARRRPAGRPGAASSPRPPRRTHPDDFLVAVIAARRSAICPGSSARPSSDAG